MRSSPLRIALVLVVFVVGLVAGLLVLRQGSDGDTSTRGSSADAATSDIWKVGDTWTVNVRQDAGAITPDGESSVAAVPFRFTVKAAPEGDAGTWLVQVKQDGAEGPFANGWKLQYAEREGAMVLTKVAVGAEPALEAELASIVLGPQFPYEVRYESAPKDRTLNAADLLERSTLPPTALPGSDAPDVGAAPPAEAPKLDAGGAPDAQG